MMLEGSDKPDIDKLSRRELERRAKETFDEYIEKRGKDHHALLEDAQFYREELRSRAERRSRRVDIILEVLIILMIGYEIYEGWQQASILDRVATNAASTSTILESVQKTMEATQIIQDRLLALNYEVSVTLDFNLSRQMISLQNIRPAKTYFGGYKFWDEKAFFQKTPGIMTQGIDYPIPGEDQIFKSASQRVQKGQKKDFSFVIYLRNERQEEYVAKFRCDADWQDHGFNFCRTESITAERWSDFPK
jgi:hypothetical protein